MAAGTFSSGRRTKNRLSTIFTLTSPRGPRAERMFLRRLASKTRLFPPLVPISP